MPAQTAPNPPQNLPAKEAGAQAKPPPGEAIIRVEHVSAAYDTKQILRDVSFEVCRHEIVVIAGESGSGKSTLLRQMIGVETPHVGRIWIDGDELGAASGEDRKRILRKIGVAFQTGALFGSMSLLENVRLPMEIFTSVPDRMMDLLALSKLQMVGLADAARKMPAELSGGMRKRAAIARALSLDPAILFLDEPSGALDPVNSAELDQLILTLRRLLNMTFVIVTHTLPSIFAIADRVLLLDSEKKTIVAEGKPEALRDSSPDPRVRAFFNRQPPAQGPPAHSQPSAGATGGPR